MRTDELDYELPPGRIATRPASRRDAAKLLVVSRSDPDLIDHCTVHDLPLHLQPNDLLVFNTSRVLPARFLGERLDTGGKVVGLYLHDADEPGHWVVLLKSRRFKEGSPVAVFDHAHKDSGLRLILVRRDPSESGAWLVRVEGGTKDSLERVGLTPLPPYILSARKQAHIRVPDEEDRRRYQTVYADQPGSVAAPTAGLHFTPELLGALDARGIQQANVVLHVGTGTFKPIDAEDLAQHEMHAETCSLGPGTPEAIESAGRVFAVGTTSARALETFAAIPDQRPDTLDTRLFISPGYEWRWCEGMLTNFHLPRSSLLAMVASMFPEGVPRLKEIYRVAIEQKYRFYSFGDAMLILP